MGNTVLPPVCRGHTGAQLCPILAPVRLVAGKLKTGGGREPPRVLEHGVTLYWPQYGITVLGAVWGTAVLLCTEASA
jgi:hypothetical protein